MALRIDYVSEGFPTGAPIANGPAILSASWDDLLRAALTVGRPNRQYVFRHGMASMYEAIFRLSLVRMALEQRRPTANRLRRTEAARTLDPSEKGAINYFLGLAISKLFAEKLLGAPWLLHLDVFRPQLNAVLTGRSRPDLVGQRADGSWLALECKGRVSMPDARAKQRAKAQAERVVSINGSQPCFRIGGIAYFKNEVLQYYWQDPEGASHGSKRAVAVHVSPDDWQHYYLPVLDLIRSNARYLEQMQREPVLMLLEHLDVKIGVRPELLRVLIESHWEEARYAAWEGSAVGEGIKYGSDGIVVEAGEKWSYPFSEGLEDQA